jgi:ParB family transcriptional regulator, chromosome partitioning protein
MSIADKLGAKTAGVKAREVEKPVDKSLKTAPAIFLEATQRMDAAEVKAEALQAELALLKNKKVRIADLQINPARRRTLSPEDFRELKENLAKHPLTHPIVVRPTAGGKLEIVAGHNRVQAYIELGREEIAADVMDFQDDQVDEAAFYSNLFNSALADFEKFQGFKRIQERTHESQSQMAARTGVSEAKLSYLFSFEKLDPQVLEVIQAAPHAIGAKAASKLVGQPVEKSIALVRQLAARSLTQADAVSDDKPRLIKSERPRPIIIKDGKSVFAKIENRQGHLVLKLRDEKLIPEVTQRLQDMIRGLLK